MTKTTTAILHQGLPREGPGDDASTAEALRRLPALPPNPVVLDLGCGPGGQALVLARALGSKVIAIDLHQPYLDELNSRAAAGGLTALVETRRADMGALDFPGGSIDLIWSEGAAYILGFQEALRRWSGLLKPGGLMAVSECTWLTDQRPDEAAAFWRAAYPGMGTVIENQRRAESVELEVLDTFTLPAAAWWENYYTPLAARARQLRPTADRELAAHLDGTEREIDLFRRQGDAYGYVFFLLRKSSG